MSNTVCTLIDGLDEDGKYLRTLLRFKLHVVHHQVTWVDHKNSGMQISPDHMTLTKQGGMDTWDKISRSKRPLTRGKNELTFRINKIPDTSTLSTSTTLVVGVHPHPNCEVAMCEPGFHVSSVGVCFGALQYPETTSRDRMGYETTWLTVGKTIRVVLDFFEDKISVFCNDELKMVNDANHKPSKSLEWYFTFMLCSPNVEIQILSSSFQI
jgi:hypothetical protein